MRRIHVAKGKPHREEEPASLVGAYLFNALLERADLREAYYLQMQVRISTDEPGELILLPFLVQILAEGYFVKNAGEEVLLAFADYAIAHMPPELGLERSAIAECLRAILAGSTEPPVDISFRNYIKIEMVIAALILRRRRRTDSELLRIIRDAEGEVSKRGVALTPV